MEDERSISCFGAVGIVVGLVMLYQAMTMDTSITTESGMSISNLSLMAEQQNHMMTGGVIAVVGCALLLVGELAIKKK